MHQGCFGQSSFVGEDVVVGTVGDYAAKVAVGGLEADVDDVPGRVLSARPRQPPSTRGGGRVRQALWAWRAGRGGQRASGRGDGGCGGRSSGRVGGGGVIVGVLSWSALSSQLWVSSFQRRCLPVIAPVRHIPSRPATVPAELSTVVNETATARSSNRRCRRPCPALPRRPPASLGLVTRWSRPMV